MYIYNIYIYIYIKMQLYIWCYSTKFCYFLMYFSLNHRIEACLQEQFHLIGR